MNPDGCEAEQAHELVIQGLTQAGERFRPGDWAERLCGMMSVYGEDRHLSYSPYLNPVIADGLRCVVVASVADRAELAHRLRSSQVPLAGVGLGLDPAHRAYEDLAGSFERLGASWICTPGEMQRPPIEWAQDGHRRLADLLEWRGVEETA